MRPTLFEILGIKIRSYGFMLVVGFLLGLRRALLRARKVGIDPNRVYDLALIVLISGVLGARLVYVLLNPDTESFREFFAVWQGGLSFHGGLVFAVAAGYIYIRRFGLPFWKCADLFAPSIALGYAFTRIGCFLNGCCYGCPTDVPWAVRFSDGGVTTPPSHPTQIYAFLANLLIFWLLTRMERMRRVPGFVFVAYLGLYGVYRFVVEIFRSGYTAHVWFWGLTQAQVVSIAMIVLSAAVIFMVYRKESPLPMVGG